MVFHETVFQDGAGRFCRLGALGCGGVLALLAVVGIAAEHAEPELPAGNSVLRIRLQGSLVERSKPTLASLFGNDEDYEYGLDDLLTAVREAETDKNIKGILIEPGAFSGALPASASSAMPFSISANLRASLSMLIRALLAGRLLSGLGGRFGVPQPRWRGRFPRPGLPLFFL
jgi:hypothetical protein